MCNRNEKMVKLVNSRR